jgi:hypothetical protein
MTGNRLRIALLGLLLLLALLLVTILNPADRGSGVPPAPPTSGTGEIAAETCGSPEGPGGRDATDETTDPDTGASEETEGAGEDDPRESNSLTEPGPTSVAVRVQDHEGKAVSAKVSIRMVRPGFRWLGSLETDGDGIVRGYLPGPGTFFAVANADGTRREMPFKVGSEGEAVELEIRFPGTAVISGRVTGKTGGLGEDVHGKQRLVGEVDLMVEAFAEGGGRPLISDVDASGRYRISGLAAGRHVLAVRSKFHAEEIEIEDGVDLAHDIKLPEGTISGRALEGWSGKPGGVAQVVVQLARSPSGVLRTFNDLGFRRLQDRLSPDADGRYAFTNLPDGEYTLFASGIGYGITRGSASISRGNRDVTLDFALKRGAEIMLTFRDADGNDLDHAVCMTGAVQFRFTGKVVGFTAGAQDFLAWAPDHAVVIKKAVKLEPDEPAPVDFVLPRAAVTRLRFVDPDGNPLRGVRVSVPKEGHDLQKVLASARKGEGISFRESGADGVVVVAGAEAGPCRVTAKMSGFALFDDEVKLPEGGGKVDVELLPADTSFRLKVRVSGVNPGGQADVLGLRLGDVVVTCAGKEISAVRDLQAAIRAASESGKIPLVVERSGKRIEVEVASGVLGVTLEEFEE